MAGEILKAENLGQVRSSRHAFFTRDWGKMTFADLRAGGVESCFARDAMARALGTLSERVLFCRQVHSADVVTVNDLWDVQNAPEADAMVTTIPGVALGLLTADCVPVLLAAGNAPVIGAAHAGWKGAFGGVLENTLQAMDALGADRKTVRAALGPCIWQASYEVGPEFPLPFLTDNRDNEKFFIQSVNNGRHLFDLQGYVVEKLRGLGVQDIALSPGDTFADSARFFSYRRATLRCEKDEGRLVSAIVLAS